MASSNSEATRFFYGYVIVIVAFSLQAIGWGIFNSFGVFFNSLMTEFGWSRAVISGGFSITMLICGVTGILQGRLNDRYGPRLLMTACGIILGTGYLLMSQVSTLWAFLLVCGLFLGAGNSGTDIVLLSTITRWFVKKRGMMSGLAKVGTGGGMFMMSIFINWSITQYGWRATFAILGVVTLSSFVGCAQFLVRDPAKKGLVPDGVKGESPFDRAPIEKGLTLRRAFRTRQFRVMSVDYFIVYFCVSTVLTHIVPHAIDLGISAANAARVLATIGVVSIVGRLVLGGAGDRIGNKLALVICFVCLTAAFIWLQVSTRLWELLLFAVIYGFAHGGFFALISPTLAEFFGTSSHGVILGSVVFTSALGSTIGPVIAGYLFDIMGSYAIFFMVLSGMSLAGLLATMSYM